MKVAGFLSSLQLAVSKCGHFTDR